MRARVGRGEALVIPANRADLSSRERWRLLKDRLFAAVMAVGGISVIVAILLIFFYLLYVVLPLFRDATVKPTASFEQGAAAAIALDEYAQTGFSIAPDGHYQFFKAGDGSVIAGGELLPAGAGKVSAVAAGDPVSHVYVAGTGDGNVGIAQVSFEVKFEGQTRVVTPKLGYPFGEQVQRATPAGDAIRLITGQASDEEATIAVVSAQGKVVLINATRQTSMLDESVSVEVTRTELDVDGSKISQLALDNQQRELYLAGSDGVLSYFDVRNKAKPQLVDRASVIGDAHHITAMSFLSGGISLVIGDDLGNLTQWFPVRDQHNNSQLKRVRRFAPLPAGVTAIAPEYFRKGFLAVDAKGNLGLYHATAERHLTTVASGLDEVAALSMAPRANAAVLASKSGKVALFAIDNPHPEVSFKALWNQIWYENRAHPDYIWQSSSASNDFEPKFSLTPLTFGTLKAAIYSMIFAVPLAVLGAIYTAYFMSAPMRRIVKPSIELMAALPTVILGFLAGLWLAPLVERELLGVLLCIPVVPASTLLFSYLLSRLPQRVKGLIPDGWEALALVPVVIFAIWANFMVGRALEVMFFDGSVTHWLTVNYGIGYDQRNSLVVAIAIGFAVIPTIFSISEDAVFSVPRHLTMGSLALGATPWQTAIKVVLLTASPGIFSGIMIGMGRAVGETMIVLMATGNTPIMDLSLFQGLRALSANIAVEMPESEVGSSHYRVLFLAAMVLFLVTFIVNTMAELVRQRLRKKYSSL
ncbi:MAG: ABC transporter permease subunit [Gammaproteobacteria bacterium]|nr:ABC transporter permease subunit [Gammaproteobacteria bacterium]